jgi:hypothetical protein
MCLALTSHLSTWMLRQIFKNHIQQRTAVWDPREDQVAVYMVVWLVLFERDPCFEFVEKSMLHEDDHMATYMLRRIPIEAHLSSSRHANQHPYAKRWI